MLIALHAESEWNVQPNLTKSMSGIQNDAKFICTKGLFVESQSTKTPCTLEEPDLTQN